MEAEFLIQYKTVEPQRGDGPSIKVLAVIPGNGEASSFIFARRQVDSLKRVGAHVEIFYLNSRTSPIPTFREAIRLRKVIKEFKPDIVHAHYGSVTSFLCALVTRNPLVISFRGSDLNGDPDVSLWRMVFGILLSQISVFRAEKVICTSKGLKKRLWWQTAKAIVIPSGVDLHRFLPIEHSRARISVSLTPQEKVVLFNRGTGSLLKGTSLARAATEYAQKLIGKIHLIELDGRSSHDRIPDYMNAADCLLLTSKREGSPNVVKEALACNLPIVSVDVGDVAEVLLGVSECHIVERDVASVGTKLAEVLRRRNRSDGVKKAELYSQETIARKIVEIYYQSLNMKT